MTQPDLGGSRPPGWIGHTSGYGLPDAFDPLPAPVEPPPPPRWLFHAVCAVMVVWVCWKASTPVPSWSAGLGTGVLLVIAAVVWLARLGNAVIRHASFDRWWLVAPIGGVLTVALLMTDAPLHARFSLADDDLSQVARQVAASPDPTAAAEELGDLGRVGSYRVSRVQAAPGGAVYFTFRTGDDFLQSAGGVAYFGSSAARPEQTGQEGLQHLRGPWYIWYGTATEGP